jgi:hypothetical protein
MIFIFSDFFDTFGGSKKSLGALALQVEQFWDEVMNDQRLRHLKHCPAHPAHLEGSMAGEELVVVGKLT